MRTTNYSLTWNGDNDTTKTIILPKSNVKPINSNVKLKKTGRRLDVSSSKKHEVNSGGESIKTDQHQLLVCAVDVIWTGDETFAIELSSSVIGNHKKPPTRTMSDAIH